MKQTFTFLLCSDYLASSAPALALLWLCAILLKSGILMRTINNNGKKSAFKEFCLHEFHITVAMRTVRLERSSPIPQAFEVEQLCCLRIKRCHPPARCDRHNNTTGLYCGIPRPTALLLRIKRRHPPARSRSHDATGLYCVVRVMPRRCERTQQPALNTRKAYRAQSKLRGEQHAETTLGRTNIQCRYACE